MARKTGKRKRRGGNTGAAQWYTAMEREHAKIETLDQAIDHMFGLDGDHHSPAAFLMCDFNFGDSQLVAQEPDFTDCPFMVRKRIDLKMGKLEKIVEYIIDAIINKLAAPGMSAETPAFILEGRAREMHDPFDGGNGFCFDGTEDYEHCTRLDLYAVRSLKLSDETRAEIERIIAWCEKRNLARYDQYIFANNRYPDLDNVKDADDINDPFCVLCVKADNSELGDIRVEAEIDFGEGRKRIKDAILFEKELPYPVELQALADEIMKAILIPEEKLPWQK